MKKSKSLWLAFACIMAVGLFIPSWGLAESNEIVIGVPTSLGFPHGKQGLQAVTLAAEEINATGGVMVGKTKHKIRIESLDIRDAAPGVPVPEALLGLEKIILDKKVNAIVVGMFRSEALMAGMEIIAKYKVPFLGTIAMTPASEAKVKEEPEKYKYVFRMCGNSKDFVALQMGISNYLKTNFGFNRVYLMHQDVLYARMAADVFKKVLSGAGWEVLGIQSYPTGASDFSSGLMKAKALGAQNIVVIFDMPQSATLIKQWISMKIPALMSGSVVPVVGGDAWKTFGDKIEGFTQLMLEIGCIPAPSVPESVRFFNAFKKRWGKSIETDHSTAAAYDAVYVLAKAIERAGTLDGSAVSDEIRKTDRKGAIGRIRFDEGNHVIFGTDNPNETALACVFQWRKPGKRVIIYPESIAEAKILLPPGLKPAK